MGTEQTTNGAQVGGSGLNVELDVAKLERDIENAFVLFAARNPKKAVAFGTAMFVSLLEFMAEENGCDKNKEIKIEGNGGRDITIHAVTPNAY